MPKQAYLGELISQAEDGQDLVSILGLTLFGPLANNPTILRGILNFNERSNDTTQNAGVASLIGTLKNIENKDGVNIDALYTTIRQLGKLTAEISEGTNIVALELPSPNELNNSRYSDNTYQNLEAYQQDFVNQVLRIYFDTLKNLNTLKVLVLVTV